MQSVVKNLFSALPLLGSAKRDSADSLRFCGVFVCMSLCTQKQTEQFFCCAKKKRRGAKRGRESRTCKHGGMVDAKASKAFRPKDGVGSSPTACTRSFLLRTKKRSEAKNLGIV